MKIRTRFTLFISAISLLSAGLVYLFVATESEEQQILLIDRELRDVGSTLLQKLSDTKAGSVPLTDYPLERYWIRLVGIDGKIRYQSDLAATVSLPDQPNRTRYFAKTRVPAEKVWIDPAEEDDRQDIGAMVTFRIMKLTLNGDGQPPLVMLAKPIPLIALELHEIFFELLGWAILFTIFVVIASYVLSGRMLQPLSTINKMTREIRESSLDQRIPLTTSRDELHALSTSLNDMFDRLQGAFDKQKQLISDASHELKSPLTILRLGTEDLLSEDLTDEKKNELEKQLVIIQRMQKLVTNLLDISRLEQQDAVTREPVNIAQLVHEVLEDFKDLIESRAIELNLNLGTGSIAADHSKIRRLLVNLIDNAVKYNLSQGGRMAITVDLGDTVTEIRVANTGNILPPTEYEAVFSQFYRVEKSRSLGFGGTGLGLTIARRIVEMHGGTITATSDADWTVFTVYLPYC